MSVSVMALVWGSTLRDRTQVDVFNYLANCGDDNGGNCFPGISRIAHFTRCSERTVIRVIGELERDGWIDVQHGRGRGLRSEYRINVAKLKSCQDVTFSRGSKMVTRASRKPDIVAQKHDNDDAPICRTVSETSEDPSTTPLCPLASEGTVDLTAKQLEHLETMANPDKRADWERQYRAMNQEAVDKRAKQDELVRKKQAEQTELEREIRDVPTARAWVMRQCGFADLGRRRGLAQILETVLAQEAAAGRLLTDTALSMARSWKEYTASGRDLVVRYGAPKFFELGLWRGPDRWHFDEKKLRQRDEARAGARVQSDSSSWGRVAANM